MGWRRWRGVCHALDMDTTEAQETLDRFRREVYQDVLGRRKDSLFALMEAKLILATIGQRYRLRPGPSAIWQTVPKQMAIARR